jgi:DNA-binding transcriptional regulator YiaG
MPEIVSGRQLRAARVLAGLTQAQFAAKAGFHERACRYWESMGDKPPTSVRSTLVKICEALKTQGVVAFSEPTPGVRIADKR